GREPAVVGELQVAVAKHQRIAEHDQLPCADGAAHRQHVSLLVSKERNLRSRWSKRRRLRCARQGIDTTEQWGCGAGRGIDAAARAVQPKLLVELRIDPVCL